MNASVKQALIELIMIHAILHVIYCLTAATQRAVYARTYQTAQITLADVNRVFCWKLLKHVYRIVEKQTLVIKKPLPVNRPLVKDDITNVRVKQALIELIVIRVTLHAIYHLITATQHAVYARTYQTAQTTLANVSKAFCQRPRKRASRIAVIMTRVTEILRTARIHRKLFHIMCVFVRMVL